MHTGVALASGPILDDPSNKNLSWIAICPAAWDDSVEVLRSFRQSQGYTAGIWTLEEINATYGGHSRLVIKQALQYARTHWSTKPRWVSFVGDHNKAGQPNDILSDWAEYNPELGGSQIGWDDSTRGLWPYMDIDDDGTAELYVGRIPANSSADVGHYVRKVIAHDSESDPGEHETAAMFLYDTQAGNNNEVWARTLAESLYYGWLHPTHSTLLKDSELGYTYAARESAAIAAWGDTPGIIVGMGTSSGWWQLVRFFDVCIPNNWSISDLPVTGKYPVVLALCCGAVGTDIGYDVDTWACRRQPVSEQLLVSQTNRGAAAVIGFTRNTKQWGTFLIGKHLVVQTFQYKARTWGEALTRGLNAAIQEDPSVRDQAFETVLEGDPAVQVYTAEVTGVEGEPRFLPVLQYANPSRRGCLFTIRLSRQSTVELEVFDVRGAKVKDVFRGTLPEGVHSLKWSGTDSAGRQAASGVYFVQLKEKGGQTTTRRLVVIE